MSALTQPAGHEIPSASVGRRIASATAQRIAFRVGGITFELRGEKDVALELDREMRDFAAPPGRADVQIRVKWDEKAAKPRGNPLFDSGGLWSVYEERGGYRFYFSSPALGAAPYKTAWFDSGFRRGEVAVVRSYFDPKAPIYPLEYPLDELLMIHRLACGEGVEVHAVGVVDELGRGHLFLGHSGAGKSTTARLWQSRSNAQILSDDRIILRIQDGQVWMYGTPWHGDAGIALPDCAVLSRIYLLEHNSKPQLSPISQGRAAAELFARSFVPQYSSKALEFSLSFLDQVARQIPCCVFRFSPDQSAVEAICDVA